jgi:hypothetical protein
MLRALFSRACRTINFSAFSRCAASFLSSSACCRFCSASKSARSRASSSSFACPVHRPHWKPSTHTRTTKTSQDLEGVFANIPQFQRDKLSLFLRHFFLFSLPFYFCGRPLQRRSLFHVFQLGFDCAFLITGFFYTMCT